MLPFSEAELETLSETVDRQLQELQRPHAAFALKKGEKPRPEPQLRALAEATGEDPRTFLARFRDAARKDICQDGGILYAQWEKYRDLASKDALKVVGGVLAGMGLTAGPLATVAVAIVVYLLYIGVQAFCEEA